MGDRMKTQNAVSENQVQNRLNMDLANSFRKNVTSMESTAATPNVGEGCSLTHLLESTGINEENDRIHETCFLITLSTAASFTPLECIRMRNTRSRVFDNDRDVLCVLHLIGIIGNKFKAPVI